MAFWIILAIIVAIPLYFIYIYNNLVSLQNSARSAWSDIEVQLKKRFNLIPNLVEIVKSYTKYEGETFEKITKARNLFANATDEKEKIEATKILNSGLNGIFAIAENYPDLKANTQFTQLQTELTKIENDIENARRYYNAVIKDYNTKIASFPDVIIAKKYNFNELPYFELEDNEREEVYKTPKVKI
jgi:LemA protein